MNLGEVGSRVTMAAPELAAAEPAAPAAAPDPNGGRPVFVKARHGDELVRLTVPAAELTVDGLEAELRRELVLTGALRMRFVDDEGDLCRLRSAQDLREALRLCVDPAPLRLEVSFAGQAPSVTPAAAEAGAGAGATGGDCAGGGEVWNGLRAAAPPGGIPAAGLPAAGVKREAASTASGAAASKRPRGNPVPGSPPAGPPPVSPEAAPADAVLAAVFTQRDKKRRGSATLPGYAGGQSPWVPCVAPFVKIHIKLVAHKTKPQPASELAAGNGDAEADLFLTTRALDNLSKVARHLGCDAGDLIHLNESRYSGLNPSVGLQKETWLLQPFRARVIAGLLVAHTGIGDAKKFRVAAYDPDGITLNVPPVNSHIENTAENACFEFEITKAHLDSLPTKADGIIGPVRLEPVDDE